MATKCKFVIGKGKGRGGITRVQRMALKVSIQQYELVPEGIHAAVLADVVDLGLVKSTYKGVTSIKLKGMFVYFLDTLQEDGKQFRLFQRFTQSLNGKATLVKILSQLGEKVPAGAKEFDVEAAALNKQVQLFVSHSDGTGDNAGKTFANITAISKPRLGQSVQPPADFVRAKDRTDK